MRTVAIVFLCLVQQEVETEALHEGLWGPKLEQLAVAPGGQRLVAIGAEGSFYSADGGDSFRPLRAEVRGPEPDLLDSPTS